MLRSRQKQQISTGKYHTLENQDLKLSSPHTSLQTAGDAADRSVWLTPRRGATSRTCQSAADCEGGRRASPLQLLHCSFSSLMGSWSLQRGSLSSARLCPVCPVCGREPSRADRQRLARTANLSRLWPASLAPSHQTNLSHNDLLEGLYRER